MKQKGAPMQPGASLVQKVYLILLLLLALPCAGHAQDAGLPAPGVSDLRFTHLTIADGLSQNGVRAILQDRRGFIWFGTYDGLNRYDGYGFKVYRSEPGNPDTLIQKTIFDLVEDAAGHLWIGTAGGLDRFDPITETFTHYLNDPNDPSSLSENLALSLLPDRDGALWVGTIGGGLNRLDPATGRFTRYAHAVGDPNSLSPGLIWQIKEDTAGDLWLATSGGVDRFERSTGRFVHYQEGAGKRQAARAILPEPGGVVWIGTESNGLARLDVQTGQVATVGRHDPNDPRSLSLDQVLHVYRDRAGVLWVATAHGLNRMVGEAGRFSVYLSDPANPDSLSDTVNWRMVEDREGNVWVGTESGGVNRFYNRPSGFAAYKPNPKDPAALQAVMTGQIREAADGKVWIAAGSLHQFDPATGQFKHYPLPPGAAGFALFAQDRAGRIWYSAGGWDNQGLQRLDLATGETRAYRHDPAQPRSLSADGVFAVFVDRAGQVWVGTDRGLDRYDPATDGFEHWTPYSDEPASSKNNVGVIYEDRAGELWLGSWYSGLMRFDPRTGQFRRYPPEPRKPGGLASNAVLSILQDHAGVIWIGGSDALDRYNADSDTFTHFTERDGLANSAVRCLLEDATGNLWISTLRGLTRFDPASGAIKNFDRADGLQTDQFIYGSCAQTRAGQMYFGYSGLHVFDPQQITANPYRPPVALTGFSVNNQPAPRGSWAAESLTLSYLDRAVAFDFAALSFVAPHKNSYRYRLEGFDAAWREVGSDRRTAAYTNLPAGSYVLRVQGSNNDGVWSDQEAALTITVTPPWWQTSLFRIAAALLALGVVLGGPYSLYHLRLRASERRRRELEGKVAVAAQALRAEMAEHEAIQAQLFDQQLALAALSERERLGRELHDGLGQVMGYVNVQAQAAGALLESGQSGPAAAALRQLAQVAQDAHADVRAYILGVRTAAAPAIGFLAALRHYLETLERAYGFRVTLDLPPSLETSPGAGLFTAEAEAQLLHIIQESLTNVRKHAAVDAARVSLTLGTRQAEIVVTDEGVGFGIRDWGLGIGDSQSPIPNPQSPVPGHFGLSMMAERAESVGGSLEVVSAPGQGTRVTVQMPLALAAGERVKGLRVLLADDHPLFLDGLRNMLTAHGMSVVGLARDGVEAQEQARAVRPDLILLDIQMPRCDGLEAARRIKVELPETTIVMLTVSASAESLFEALKLGASGYILKSASSELFFDTLASLLRGEVVFSAEVAARLLAEFAPPAKTPDPKVLPGLTERQTEVLRLVARGLTYKEVGARLHLAEITVKYHIGEILNRLHVQSRREAVAYAVRGGVDKK